MTSVSKSPAHSAPPGGLSPAMRQYAQQKKQAGDAVLLFRMGDFYETFYDDAKLVSRVLGIALTSRSKGENPIPLAGIPYHALDNYLKKLVEAGYRVAISEQVEDAKQAKGIVKREIVRVVTPGTLTDEMLLDEHDDSALAAVCVRAERVGLAVVELASGRFRVFDPGSEALIDELVRLRPAELLVDETAFETTGDSLSRRMAETVQSICNTAIAHRPAFEWGEHHAEQTLRDHFGVASLTGFGIEQVDVSVCAAGAILTYLNETQKTSLSHVTKIVRHTTTAYVQIDHNSWRSLEIDRTLRSGAIEGSVLHAIDRTVHPIGVRRLRRWLGAPLTDVDDIRARQDAIGAFIESSATCTEVRTLLKGMADVERIASRVALGRASPRDLAGLGITLGHLPALQRALADLGPAMLREVGDGFSDTEGLAHELQRSIRPDAPPTIREGGIIAAGYDAELDRLRAIGADGRTWLADYQKREVEATGINGLKIAFNRVFGYYIEISNTHRDRVPAHYVRRQTVKNAERYITDELKKYESEVLTAEERAQARETTLFEGIRELVAAEISVLQRVADGLGRLDVLAALAELAVDQRYTRPTLVEECCLHIVDGRHPVLDRVLEGQFVPNDCRMSARDSRVIIITGPNMAGKSTYIRQVALLTLLAQCGSYVPASEMTFSPVDRIFARVGASDELARGQSTFMVEMSEAANILNNATDRSLVILDELGRGTSTFDGLSLAWAITEHLAETIGCRTLVATHYHELTELADLHEGISNCNVAVREWEKSDTGESSIVFLHRIVPGSTDKSYGVHVARLAGVPQKVVQRSREILAELERNFARESHTAELSGRPVPPDAQLTLFENRAEAVARKLQETDINSLTPLDALQRLRELQDDLS